MNLETEYLGMSKLFKYAIKSYFKNVTLCAMPWNFLQHIGQLHIRGTKSLLPSVAFVTHYTPLCWPGLFFCRWYSFWKMPFNKSRQFFLYIITTFRTNYVAYSQIIRATWVIIVTTTTLIRSCKFVKRFQSHPQTGLPLCQYRTDCCFKVKENAKAAVKKQSVDIWRRCRTPFESYKPQLRDDNDNIHFMFHFLVRKKHKAVCAIRDCKT